MVLAAAIVGSGELIATTTLGAQAGYVALWVVLLSCAVKPAVQAELGRYTIATGETGLEALDRVPGPRLGVSWILWAWAATVFLSLLQVGGMYGGLAQLLNLLVPAVPAAAWALVLLALTLALVLGGGYERVERLALVKVALFTLLTVLAAIVLTRQGEHFSWARVAEGLRFRLPATGFATALAVFGITGVGATELFMYPYWCVEKGYARFVGPNDGSAARLARARGWIRLMHADVAASMVLYSLATLAFYLLGAGVLSPLGLVPSARDMIPTLSRLYTDTLGGWVLPLFYLGATVTLYGTIFAATAAHSRLYADLCRVMGLFDRSDYAAAPRLPPPLHGAADRGAGAALPPLRVAGEDGRGRRHHAVGDAADHGRGRPVPAPPAAAAGARAGAGRDPGPLGGHAGDGRGDRVLALRARRRTVSGATGGAARIGG